VAEQGLDQYREDRAMKEIARGLKFPEGPIAMSDGSALVVEIEGGNLTRVEPDGTLTVVGRCGGVTLSTGYVECFDPYVLTN
jgi:sugar lactone lactonase YvrE